MEKNQISNRIEALREVMRREHLSAFIFPSTDPHHSEYVPDRWKGREWISGFDGSAGTAVVTLKSAALWTDSRYFLAAADQLSGTEFQLMKLKVAGTPTIPEWLDQELSDISGAEVGCDGWVNSYADVEQLKSDLRACHGMTLRINLDPLERIWKDRPQVPENKVTIHPLEFAGERASDKLSRIRQKLRQRHCDGMLMSALDDIAWTLNLRGTDVHCNPVFVAYLLIASNKATLFIDPRKLTPEVVEYLKGEGVETDGYDKVLDGLRRYGEYNILMDSVETNAMVAAAEMPHCKKVMLQSPVPAMKAIKNATEIQGFRNAMKRDGVAMVKLLRWLKPAVAAGGETEMSVDRKLTGFRAEQKYFRDISFDTIAGYGPHGAIVHYEASPETDVPLKPEGLLLLDSGAQYSDGTTDITRTIALGPVTEEERRVYTLVLKGHIQLELAKFPDGASGTQIDALAREPLWRSGLNFLHGTGHGVGSYLCVHEGPHQIRMEYMPAPLHAGMTVTDEPGIYVAGKFGVRIENTLLIEADQQTEFGSFLKMDSLTLCPIDTTPLDVAFLTLEEREWLNAYHARVYNELSPLLNEEEREWLRKATEKI
ncbi:MAG: aminopeptidase P family protein [Prevotella sp.]|jgi:Xaa-Pro aminopeptidase